SARGRRAGRPATVRASSGAAPSRDRPDDGGAPEVAGLLPATGADDEPSAPGGRAGTHVLEAVTGRSVRPSCPSCLETDTVVLDDQRDRVRSGLEDHPRAVGACVTGHVG